MDYEQKYKEALKVIEGLYNVVRYQSSSDALLTSQMIEKAFPELKESEDERIRKELKRAIAVALDYSYFDKETADNCLAWLEKQGEQKPMKVYRVENEAEQKQEWSEEDEKLYISALWHIKNSCGNGGNDSGEYEVYNWLKSIRDRVQPQQKQEWSEKDEK